MATIKYWNGSAWELAIVGKQGPVGPTGPTGPAGQASLQRFRYVATGGQTSVSGTDANGNTLAYTPGLEEVFINGAAQVRGQDYTATNGTSITGITALIAGDVVEIYAWGVFNVANTISNTLIDAKGDILAGTGADSVGRLAVGSNNQVLTADSSTATGLKWAAPDPLTTKGDLFTFSTVEDRLPVGTNGQYLQADSTTATGLKWAAVNAGSMTLISTTSLTGSQVNLTSIPQTYQALKLFVVSPQPASSDAQLQFLLNNNSNNPTYSSTTGGQAFIDSSAINNPSINSFNCVANSNSVPNVIEFNLPYYTNSSFRKYGYVTGVTRIVQSPNNYGYGIKPFFADITSAITQINMFFGGQNFAGGTAFLYGVN